MTIDLDSTICETYGLAQEGARHHSYAGQRAYHPLLARASTNRAGTGDVLMSRLHEDRANTVRGAAHFLCETVGRVATLAPEDNSPHGHWQPLRAGCARSSELMSPFNFHNRRVDQSDYCLGFVGIRR